MKKLFAIMLALVLALSCTAVLAEDAQPEPDAPFGGLWEAERTEIEINWEEEGYRVYVRGSDSATSYSVWEYSCLYDEATNTIKSMPTGIHTEVTVAEDGTSIFNFSSYFSTCNWRGNDSLHRGYGRKQFAGADHQDGKHIVCCTKERAC